MALTDELWEFWGNLNQGTIDWEFIYGDKPGKEEREEAFDMLIKRGFVAQESTPKGIRRKWVVKGDGIMINPQRRGRIFYFKGHGYAVSYAHYIRKQQNCSYKRIEVDYVRKPSS